MTESQFQSKLIKEIKARFPGCIVLKNDPTYIQGIPDLSIFYHDKWAMLEVKVDEDSNHQPNQDYYVETANKMSFCRFIFPSNKEEVINELARSFQAGT